MSRGSSFDSHLFAEAFREHHSAGVIDLDDFSHYTSHYFNGIMVLIMLMEKWGIIVHLSSFFFLFQIRTSCCRPLGARLRVEK